MRDTKGKTMTAEQLANQPGRKIAIAMRACYDECPKHWDEKAQRVASAASESEVYRGLLNFDWMADLPSQNKLIAKAATIIWHELAAAR